MKVSNRALLLCFVALFCSLSGRSEVAYSQDADWIADGAFFNFGSSWSTGVVPSGTAHFDRDAAYPVRFTADANLDTAEVSAGQVQFLLDPGALEVTTLKLNGPSGTELELARGRVDAVQVRIAPSPGDEASLRLSNGAELHVGPKDTIFGISGGLVLGPGAGSIELISGGSLVTAGTAIDSGAILLFEGGSWIDTEVLDLGAGGSSDPAVLYTRYGSSTILSSFNAGLQGVGANVIVEQDSVIKVLEDFQANDVKLSLKAGVIQVDGTLFYGPKLNLTLFDGTLDVGALRRMPDANRLPTFPSGRIRVRGDLSVSDYGRAVANDETLQVDGALRVGPTEIFHLGNGKLIAGSLSGRGHFDFTSSNRGQLEVGQLRLGLNAGEPTTLTIGDPSKLYSGERMQTDIRNSATVAAGATLVLDGVDFSASNLAVAGDLMSRDTIFRIAQSQSSAPATGVAITGTARLTDVTIHSDFRVDPGGDILVFKQVVFDGAVTLSGAVRGSGHTSLLGTLDIENAPSDPKAIVFTGDLTLGPDHHLFLDIGHADYERLIVGSLLELDGQLTVRAAADFNPHPGDVFNFFTAQTLLGSFDSIDLPALGPNLAWALTPASAMIVAIPEPAALGLLAAGGLILFLRRRA